MNLFLDSILFPWSKYLSLCRCHSPDHRSLVVNLKQEVWDLKQEVWALSFWLSFSRLGLLGPLHFHMNFRIHLSLSFTISQSLLKLMSIESVMLSNRLNLCHPLLLLPSIFPSIRVFSNESDLRIRWPKYLSFSISFSPSNEYSGLISFRIDWFDLLAVQGTLKSLLQTTGQKHQFFSAQPSLWSNSHICTGLLEKS